MDKQAILSQAFTAREEEVLQYQINIDNFRLAIEKAKSDPDLVDFVVNLKSLLDSSVLEQKKAKIMLEVVKEQLEELQ